MKTHSTAQAIRLLELHPDWVFEAPQCVGYQKQRLTATASYFLIEKDWCGRWVPESLPDYRNSEPIGFGWTW